MEPDTTLLVVDTTQPLMPDVMARLRGRICANDHERIGHHEPFCPLCIARRLCVEKAEIITLMEQRYVLVEEKNQILSGERAMLMNKLFEMRQTMIELGYPQ